MIAVAKPVTASFPSDSGLSGGDTIARVASIPTHPTLLLALGNTSGRLYKMAEGDSAFSRTAYASALNTNGFIWSFRNGVILADSGALGSVKLWRSTDNGDTFAEVIGSESSVEFSSTGYLIDWSFVEGPDGVAIAAEYGVTAADSRVGHRLFYTDDYGATWSIAFDNATLPVDDQWNHLHAVHWHAPTSRFVVAVGDSLRARIFTLDADGTNLTEITPRPNGPQPVWFADYSDTEIVFGDDTCAQIGLLNVVTGATRQVFWGLRTAPNQNFVWNISQYGGLYYAFQFNSQGGTTRWENNLLVSSSPLGPWTVAYVFASTVSGCRGFAGYRNGLLHFRVDGASAGLHFTIAPVTLRTRPSVAARPVRTNTEQANASTQTALGWSASGCTLSIASGQGKNGDNCIKVTGSGTGATPVASRLWVGGPIGQVTAGNFYQASFWVKPITGNRSLQVSAQFVIATAAAGNAKYFHCGANQWTRIYCHGHRAPTGVTNCSLSLQLQASDNIAADPPMILIDQIELTESPMDTEFLAGGGTQAETAHAKTLPSRAKWTEFFWFAPTMSHMDGACERSASTRPSWCVRSWKVGTKIIELWVHAGVRGTCNGAPTNASNSVVTANESIFRSEMVGELLHVVRAAQNNHQSGKILTYTSPTQVTISTNAGWLANGDDIVVEAPRCELRVDDGVHAESLFTPRIPYLRDAGIGFAVQVGGASDDKLRGWALYNGTLHAFAPSTNEYSGFLNTEVSVQYGASSLTADRTTGFPGQIGAIRDTGYVAEADLVAGMCRQGAGLLGSGLF